MSIADHPDTVDLTTPSSPVAAWAAAVAASRHTVALDERDPHARTCAPWCSSAPTHLATTTPEDRVCFSETATVLLANHQGEPAGQGKELDSARAVVSLAQQHDAAEAVIEVGRISYVAHPDRGSVPSAFGLGQLRPAEARQLAALLVLAADTATAGGVR